MHSCPVFSEEDICRAGKLGTSTIFEASGLSTSAVDAAVRPIWVGAAVAGPAYPVACAPGDNLAIHVAMEQVSSGSVLVVTTSGFIAGYWGEVLTVAAERAGVRGLITDGGVRDVAALTARRFPVFARGISVRGTLKASVPSVGQPITLMGTPVATGDLVVGDDDGVVIIPAESVLATLAGAQARAEAEAVMMSELQQGRSTMELLGLSLDRTRSV